MGRAGASGRGGRSLAYFVPSFILPSLGETSIPNIAYNRIGSDFFAVSVAFRLIGVTGLTVAMLLFPISFAVAITRYRLWDVDVVVNRTLVYLAVTGSLAVIYVVSIALLGLVSRELVFRGESGQGNALVIVLSTLAIAVLFSPVRRRVQDLIDGGSTVRSTTRPRPWPASAPGPATR